MKVLFETHGNFDSTIDWLKGFSRKIPTRALHDTGRKGVAELSRATPRDTGQTAASWDYVIGFDRDGPEIYWVNRAHPHTGVSVARLIQVGHGTRNGGYVPPYNYIIPAMDKTFANAGKKVLEEMMDV